MGTARLMEPCTSIYTHPPDPQSAPTHHSTLTPCLWLTWQGSGTACTAVEKEWEIPAPSGKDTWHRLEPWLSADVAHNTAPTPTPGMDTCLLCDPSVLSETHCDLPHILFPLPTFLPALLAWHLVPNTAGAAALFSLPDMGERSCASGPPDSLALPSPLPASHSAGSSRNRR